MTRGEARKVVTAVMATLWDRRPYKWELAKFRWEEDGELVECDGTHEGECDEASSCRETVLWKEMMETMEDAVMDLALPLKEEQQD